MSASCGEWPFQELSFDVERKGDEVLHTFLVRETPQLVLEELKTLSTEQVVMGNGYTVQGIIYQAVTDSYQVTIAKGNLFMKMIVTPYQGGSKIVLFAVPFPLPNQGILKPLYPYRLGDEHTAPCTRYDGHST